MNTTTTASDITVVLYLLSFPIIFNNFVIILLPDIVLPSCINGYYLLSDFYEIVVFLDTSNKPSTKIYKLIFLQFYTLYL